MALEEGLVPAYLIVAVLEAGLSFFVLELFAARRSVLLRLEDSSFWSSLAFVAPRTG